MFSRNLIAIVTFAFSVSAHSSGGDCSAIDSMTPGHGQQGPGKSPYSVRSTTNSFKAGQTITVEIGAEDTLKGFALQARDENGKRVGEFPLVGDEETKYCIKYHCPNEKSALTHSSSSCDSRSGCSSTNPCKFQITWKAPKIQTQSEVPNAIGGKIRFQLTGVREYTTWYKVQSDWTNFENEGAAEQKVEGEKIVADQKIGADQQKGAEQKGAEQKGAAEKGAAEKIDAGSVKDKNDKNFSCGNDELSRWCPKTCNDQICKSWTLCSGLCKKTCCGKN